MNDIHVTAPAPVYVYSPTGTPAVVAVPGEPVNVIVPSAPPIEVQPGSTFQGTLAENASAYSVVVSLADGLHVADPANPAHAGLVCGLLTQSGVAGAVVQGLQSGPLQGFSGPPGRAFIASNGQPGALPPTAAWRQPIGVIGANGVLLVQLGPSTLTV